MARLARAGSVMESRIIKIGIATLVSAKTTKLWLMSNSKTTPARMSVRAPGLYRWR